MVAFIFLNMTNVSFGIEQCHCQMSHWQIVLLLIKQNYVSVIILLLIASISVAAIFLGAFIWSVKSGQYDDEESPPVRILFDDFKQ
jgi:cbb3-type cytochrome oxidase maturation protein